MAASVLQSCLANIIQFGQHFAKLY